MYLRHLFLLPVYVLTAAIPLIGRPGANLEYEYTLLASYLALLLIPTAALWLPKQYLPRDSEQRWHVPVATEMLWILFISPLAGLLPGFYMFWSGACDCSSSGWVFWMVVQWFPAWVLAHVGYHAILRLRTNGGPKLQATLTWYACLAASFIYAGLSLWIHPQKRIAGLVTGLWHGPVYDDWIAFDGGMLLARLSHLLLGLALLLFAVAHRRQHGRLIVAGVLILGWFGTSVVSGRYHSVRNGTTALNALLHAEIPGDGFVLHYRPRPDEVQQPASVAEAPVSIQRLHRDTAFHVMELKNIFGGNDLPQVQVYVYPDDDKKKLWFGGGSTDVADVRTPSIHISRDSWPHPTLRHELVHALASGFGWHGLGFHPNMAFTEGLAVALAPQSSGMGLDSGAAALIDSGKLPDIEALFSPAFWRESGTRAYTVAGSFIRYLISTHGIDSVRRLYAGASFEEALKTGKSEVIKAWKDKVLAGYDREREAMFAEALFRHPGILSDVCPHSKADLKRPRKDGVFVRLRQPLGFKPDEDYLPWLIELNKDAVGTRLALWRRLIREAASDRLPSLGRLETWQETLANARVMPPAKLDDVEMGILEADVLRVLGKTTESVTLLQSLAEAGKAKYFGDSLNREIHARLAVESSVAPELAPDWRKFLAGWRKSMPDAPFNGSPFIIQYLKLRNERDGRQDPRLLLELFAAVTPDPALPKTFQVEWYRFLALKLMRKNEFKSSADAWEAAAAAEQRPGTKELFAEHARRARYYQSLGPVTTNTTAAAETN